MAAHAPHPRYPMQCQLGDSSQPAPAALVPCFPPTIHTKGIKPQPSLRGRGGNPRPQLFVRQHRRWCPPGNAYRKKRYKKTSKKLFAFPDTRVLEQVNPSRIGGRRRARPKNRRGQQVGLPPPIRDARSKAIKPRGHETQEYLAVRSPPRQASAPMVRSAVVRSVVKMRLLEGLALHDSADL